MGLPSRQLSPLTLPTKRLSVRRLAIRDADLHLADVEAALPLVLRELLAVLEVLAQGASGDYGGLTLGVEDLLVGVRDLSQGV